MFAIVISRGALMIVDVEQGFMPWLMDRVCEEIQKCELGRLVVDGMIREIVAARSQAFQVTTNYDESLAATILASFC